MLLSSDSLHNANVAALMRCYALWELVLAAPGNGDVVDGFRHAPILDALDSIILSVLNSDDAADFEACINLRELFGPYDTPDREHAILTAVNRAGSMLRHPSHS